MTTIAYRDGVMAADSGAWVGDAILPFARKLAKGKSGTLYGVAGHTAEAHAFLEWVDSGEDGDWPKGEKEPEGRSSMIVLVARIGGPIMIYTPRGNEVYDAPYFAIGAGNVGALCAMHAGATAEQALLACRAHASGAEGPIKTITHNLIRAASIAAE